MHQNARSYAFFMAQTSGRNVESAVPRGGDQRARAARVGERLDLAEQTADRVPLRFRHPLPVFVDRFDLGFLEPAPVEPGKPVKREKNRARREFGTWRRTVRGLYCM